MGIWRFRFSVCLDTACSSYHYFFEIDVAKRAVRSIALLYFAVLSLMTFLHPAAVGFIYPESSDHRIFDTTNILIPQVSARRKFLDTTRFGNILKGIHIDNTGVPVAYRRFQEVESSSMDM